MTDLATLADEIRKLAPVVPLDRAWWSARQVHDSRRTALTRLSKTFDALELARISGHRDLRILLQCYYQPKIEDLARKMD